MTTAEAPAVRTITYVRAITEAMSQVMREDENVFLAGEDVALYGGVFGTSRGMLEEFGPERVIDTPIAEAGLMGLGLGASATGLRPIIEIMFMDFIGVCMDQIVNQAAKMKYMFGGKAVLPLTIRTMAGGGMGMAAQHSQSLEAWFCHVPGLKVVMPSNPYDAKGLLVAAIRDDNPVHRCRGQDIARAQRRGARRALRGADWQSEHRPAKGPTLRSSRSERWSASP